MRKLSTWFVGLLCAGLFLISCEKNKGEDPSGPGPGPDPNPNTEVPETLPAIQKPVTYNVSSKIKGYQEALPARYDSTTKKYPLIIFIHGVGEQGNGSTDLGKITNNAIPALLKNKKFPPSFTSNGKEYSFIVLSPQCTAWPAPADFTALLNYAITKYRVDTTRLYVVGLSMGGGATWEFSAAAATRLAAIVPICGASSPNDARAKSIADAGLAVWAFHNKDDGTVTVANSTGYVNKINALSPKVPAKITLWETGGHDSWTKATNPATKENNMNIYEWMLQYQRTKN